MEKESRFSIGRYISTLYRYMNMYLRIHLEKYGIGSGQVPVLMMISRRGFVSQEEIARELLLDKSTVSKALRKLEKSGFVTRKADPADKRAFIISLTDKGNEIIPELREVLSSFTRIFLEGAAEGEAGQIEALLEMMCGKAVAAIEEAGVFREPAGK